MGSIDVSAEGKVEAPAAAVYGYLADMREHHPHFLPPAFSGFQVESGGVGAGTITHFTVTAGGRSREYRMRVSEPEPGRVLVESDTNSSLVTTYTVTPDGGASRVRISTTWDGASGVGGFFERRFAPRAMQGIYADALERLNAYAAAPDRSQPRLPSSPAEPLARRCHVPVSRGAAAGVVDASASRACRRARISSGV